MKRRERILTENELVSLLMQHGRYSVPLTAEKYL